MTRRVSILLEHLFSFMPSDICFLVHLVSLKKKFLDLLFEILLGNHHIFRNLDGLFQLTVEFQYACMIRDTITCMPRSS